MLVKTFRRLAWLLTLCATSVLSADGEPGNLLEHLRKVRPELKFTYAGPTPVAGLYKVEIERGPVIYVTEDGRHFVTGDLFEVGPEGFVNLAELARQKERRQLLAHVNESDMIVFAPEGEVKGTVTVFTDVDCFYCQKLHKEVPELNKLGVKLRYLAYPRAGIGSESYRKIATAWCAKDRQDAITRLKARETLPENVCAGNPVAAQFKLGQQMGVTGTPALIFDDGELLPGYMPAKALADRVIGG